MLPFQAAPLLPKFSFRENGKIYETYHPAVGDIQSHLEQAGPEALFALKTEQMIQDGLKEAASQPHDINYQGIWEDAFLYNGYENGKYRFMTGFFLQNIQERGFLYNSSYHNKNAVNPKLGNNWIVFAMWYNKENCIPEKDIKGDKVVLGVTNPRLYLPDVVIKLLDMEFGYDMERTRHR